MIKRRGERRIVFPWEARGGWLRRIGLHRLQPFLAFVAVVSLIVAISVRDRRKAGVRRTRATMLELRQALNSYLADHQDECPKSFDDLRNYGSVKGVPVDAWGQPFALTCPDPTGERPYRLMSGGPDGIIGGFDRVE